MEASPSRLSLILMPRTYESASPKKLGQDTLTYDLVDFLISHLHSYNEAWRLTAKPASADLAIIMRVRPAKTIASGSLLVLSSAVESAYGQNGSTAYSTERY